MYTLRTLLLTDLFHIHLTDVIGTSVRTFPEKHLTDVTDYGSFFLHLTDLLGNVRTDVMNVRTDVK